MIGIADLQPTKPMWQNAPEVWGPQMQTILNTQYKFLSFTWWFENISL